MKNSGIIKPIENITAWALTKVGLYSDDAHALVMRTGLAESGFIHLTQIVGPAIGFFQMEPDTIYDIWENYAMYRPNIATALHSLGFDESDASMSVLGSIALQAAFCRMQYRRDSNPLPKYGKIQAQADYWKRVYNTKLGKGTPEHFIKMNKGYTTTY